MRASDFPDCPRHEESEVFVRSDRSAGLGRLWRRLPPTWHEGTKDCTRGWAAILATFCNLWTGGSRAQAADGINAWTHRAVSAGTRAHRAAPPKRENPNGPCACAGHIRCQVGADQRRAQGKLARSGRWARLLACRHQLMCRHVAPQIQYDRSRLSIAAIPNTSRPCQKLSLTLIDSHFALEIR